MLTHFNATVGGVLFPTIYLIGLMIIPYIDRSPYKAARDRKMVWVFFLRIMIGGLLMTFIGSFLPRPGWNWVWPGWDLLHPMTISRSRTGRPTGRRREMTGAPSCAASSGWGLGS